MTILEPQATWANWDDLERDALACTKCPLATAGRTQVVFGVGSRDADLVFVGEGPGAEEDKQGIPFVGRAGQLLTKLIEGIGMTRDEVYIANVVKCRPPGNRDPQPEEIETCRPYLEAQLGFLDPKVIVTLGNFATRFILDRQIGITKARGQLFNYGPATVIPTFHPAAALRGSRFGGVSSIDHMRQDFRLVRSTLDSMPSPEPHEVAQEDLASSEQLGLF